MRKFVSFIVVIAITTLCSCSSLPEHLVKENGSYYLIVDELNSDSYSANNSSLRIAPSLRFESIEELKNDIETANFTKSELKELRRFEKDEDGKILICNLDDLYEPVFPAEYSEYTVILVGNYYNFRAETAADSNSVYFQVTTQEHFERERDEILSSGDDLREATTSVVGDRNATVYTYSATESDGKRRTEVERKRLIYSFEKDGETFYVLESYRYSSDSTPYMITVCGPSKDKYIILYITDLQTRPSIEWLSSFGLVEYSE